MGLSVEERFWAKVQKGGDSDCWLWTAGRYSNGYGQFWRNGREVPAHRVSWEMVNGPIPSGMLACHTCDNHLCVNPAHLFLGSHGDNTQDMMSKGRGRYVAHGGERNGSAVLSESQVRLIKAELADGHSLADIGRRYGVTKQAIWLIKQGKTWGHIS